MLTYTYVSKGKFALMEKTKPVLQHERIFLQNHSPQWSFLSVSLLRSSERRF